MLWDIGEANVRRSANVLTRTRQDDGVFSAAVAPLKVVSLFLPLVSFALSLSTVPSELIRIGSMARVAPVLWVTYLVKNRPGSTYSPVRDSSLPPPLYCWTPSHHSCYLYYHWRWPVTWKVRWGHKFLRSWRRESAEHYRQGTIALQTWLLWHRSIWQDWRTRTYQTLWCTILLRTSASWLVGSLVGRLVSRPIY